MQRNNVNRLNLAITWLLIVEQIFGGSLASLNSCVQRNNVNLTGLLNHLLTIAIPVTLHCALFYKAFCHGLTEYFSTSKSFLYWFWP